MTRRGRHPQMDPSTSLRSASLRSAGSGQALLPDRRQRGGWGVECEWDEGIAGFTKPAPRGTGRGRSVHPAHTVPPAHAPPRAPTGAARPREQGSQRPNLCDPAEATDGPASLIRCYDCAHAREVSETDPIEWRCRAGRLRGGRVHRPGTPYIQAYLLRRHRCE